MRHGRALLAVAAITVAAAAAADETWRGEIALEGRNFPASPLDGSQHGANLSISGNVEYYRQWDDDRQSLTVKPFARVDQHDDERTHVDLREAVWIYADDGLEIRAGLDKVFWGVTEVFHLVDIINQTDVLENPDGEQKLGQAMLKVSLERDWGVVDLFVMPWFRERQFPSRDGRPRTQPRIDADRASFENDREAYHPDVAVRWSKNLGDWDLGIAHFHGTGREPMLLPALDDDGRPVLAPRYVVIHQTSVDLQGAVENWLWKLEALRRSGQGETFTAATGGFEYTFYGILDGSSDLGTLFELMWDERGAEATTPFNRDVFAGVRWVVNDVDGSEVLAGVVSDWQNGTRFLNLEASRRIGNDWRVDVQARWWSNVDDDDPVFGLRQDDYVELRLTRYF
ncbi:MAG: hypothetical protein QNJ91_12910 [Gammaproteobacteria bacterium]|nr:hypothetical protein [Gammaproteobacteria bacterium]